MAAGDISSADEQEGGGERPRRSPPTGMHPLVAWCLACVILVGLGAALVYGFERVFYHTPEFRATVSAYHGLDPDPDAGAAAAPTFRIAFRVDNERNIRRFCARRGSVAVSYAGVPIAHAALPAFCVPRRSARTVPVVATGGETRGMPRELHRLVQAQLRRRERVPLTVQVTMDEFTTYEDLPMLLWCRAALDGKPVRPSLCPRFYLIKDGFHRTMPPILTFSIP
ncbi:hypothetical protein ACP70R_038429 [Stipagrostis hirtigluma subsp. patula]